MIQLNIKFDPDSDNQTEREICEFLKDAPKKWVVQESLKMYMKKYKAMYSDVVVNSKDKETDTGEDITF